MSERKAGDSADSVDSGPSGCAESGRLPASRAGRLLVMSECARPAMGLPSVTLKPCVLPGCVGRARWSGASGSRESSLESFSSGAVFAGARDRAVAHPGTRSYTPARGRTPRHAVVHPSARSYTPARGRTPQRAVVPSCVRSYVREDLRYDRAGSRTTARPPGTTARGSRTTFLQLGHRVRIVPVPHASDPRRGVVGDGLDTAFPHASEDPAAAPPAPRRPKSRFRRETGISARVRRRRRRTRARTPDSRLRRPNATSSNRTHRGTGPISSRNSTDLDAKGVADAGARGVDQTS